MSDKILPLFSSLASLARWMFREILNHIHVANSDTASGQLFWLSGKCGFDQKMQFCEIQNTVGRVQPVHGLNTIV